MARSKSHGQATGVSTEPYIPSKILAKTRQSTPVIPTGNQKHATPIRLGRFSAENFCRDPKRRRELGLRPIPTMESDLIDELRR